MQGGRGGLRKVQVAKEVAGAGARENREREGYGRREKKGWEAGSLRWTGSGIEIQKGKLSLFVTAYHPVKETNPTTTPPPPLPNKEIRTVPGLQTSFFFPSFFFVRSLAVSVFFVVLFFFLLPFPFKYKLYFSL